MPLRATLRPNSRFFGPRLRGMRPKGQCLNAVLKRCRDVCSSCKLRTPSVTWASNKFSRWNMELKIFSAAIFSLGIFGI